MRNLVCSLFCVILFSGVVAQTGKTAHVTTWKEFNLDDKFERLLGNYFHEQYMTDSLYLSAPEMEWKGTYQRRTQELSRLMKEDDKIINDIYEYYKQNVRIPGYQFDSLLSYTDSFFRITQDACITERFISFVLPHYSAESQPDHYFQSHALQALTLVQIAKEGDREGIFQALESLNKAADFVAANYRKFKDDVSLEYIDLVYQELLSPQWLEMRKMTLTDAYDRYRELQEMNLWLESHPELPFSYMRRRRLAVIYYDYEYKTLDYLMSERSQNESNPVVKLFSKFYKKHYDLKSQLWKEHRSDRFRSPMTSELQYFKVMYFNGLSTALETFRSIDSLYQCHKVVEDVNPILTELLTFLNEALYYMDITDEMTEEEKGQQALSYLRDLRYYVKRIYMFDRKNELYDKMEEIALNPHFFEHLSGDDRNLLYQDLIVKADAEIYSHSTLVTWIGYNMVDVLIAQHPQMLVGLLDCKTEPQVQEHRDDFLVFFWNACLSHDVGLLRMARTTNQHYRSLTSHERQLLRFHQIHGADMLQVNSYHSRYYDVTLGHHKWYNGKGFPVSFDNVSSRYRVLIDLLSIADFLEGGSELPSEGNTGGFDERIEELRQLAGTRFNPDLVNMILESEALMSRTRIICEEAELNLRYQVYQEYFTENNTRP